MSVTFIRYLHTNRFEYDLCDRVSPVTSDVGCPLSVKAKGNMAELASWRCAIKILPERTNHYGSRVQDSEGNSILLHKKYL